MLKNDLRSKSIAKICKKKKKSPNPYKTHNMKNIQKKRKLFHNK
jgi:hypothetical protein